MAAKLRDLGVPGPIVVGQLCRRLGLSRAQAYRYLAAANERRADANNGGLQAPPKFTEARLMLQTVLMDCITDAVIDGERKDIARLSKELREVLKMGGIGEHRDEEQQTQMVRQTYGRNGDPKGSDSK